MIGRDIEPHDLVIAAFSLGFYGLAAALETRLRCNPGGPPFGMRVGGPGRWRSIVQSSEKSYHEKGLPRLHLPGKHSP